jgi:hypothetical protein
MARIAGDKPYYEWVLRGADGTLHEDNTIQLPSVTTVIKATLAAPALLKWTYDKTVEGVEMLLDSLPPGMTIDSLLNDDLDAALLASRLHPNDIRDDASGRGQDAHSFLETLGGMTHDEGIETAIDVCRHTSDPFRHAVADWWATFRPYVHASEELLRSLEHGYAGTVDLAWSPIRRGAPIISDLKTRKANSRMYRDDEAQTGAYLLAWNEMFPDNAARQRSIIIAMDDGSFAYHIAKAPPEVFLSILSLYNELN